MSYTSSLLTGKSLIFGGAGTIPASTVSYIVGDAVNGNVIANVATGKSITGKVAAVTYLSLAGTSNTIGDVASGGHFYSDSTTSRIKNASATQFQCFTTGAYIDRSDALYIRTSGGTNKYKLSDTLMECDRISLGGTLGSSVDPGAGGLSLVGALKLGSAISNASAISWTSASGQYIQLVVTGQGGMFIVGYSLVSTTQGNSFWTIGNGAAATGYVDYGGTDLKYNVPTGGTHRKYVNNVEKLSISTSTLALNALVLTSTANTTWYNATGVYTKIGLGSTPLLTLGTVSSHTNDNNWCLGANNSATYAGIEFTTYHNDVRHYTPTYAYHYVNGNTARCLSLGINGGGNTGDETFGIGGLAGYSWSTTTHGGIMYAPGYYMVFGVKTGEWISHAFNGTAKQRFSAALCEFDRLSLGGTIGSSVDPGAGGLNLTGNVLFTTSASYIKGTTGLYILGDRASATTGFVALGGGNTFAQGTGALIAVYGITSGAPGAITYYTGSSGASAKHYFYDKNALNQFTIDETGTAINKGYRTTGIVTKTTTYTATVDDYIILLNHATVGIVLTLPAATASGRTYIIKNINAALCTVQASGAELIDGANTYNVASTVCLKIVDTTSGVWRII